MLALLRVAPLLPSPTLRAVPWRCQVGTGKQAHRSNWKAEFGCHRPGRATPRPQPLMYFFSGRRCSFSPALTPHQANFDSFLSQTVGSSQYPTCLCRILLLTASFFALRVQRYRWLEAPIFLLFETVIL